MPPSMAPSVVPENHPSAGPRLALEPGQLEILAGLVAARVSDLADTDTRWMDRAAVMAHTGFGGSTVSRAFTGSMDVPKLHSHSIGGRGRPNTRRAVVDAWMCGADEQQQIQVCGCNRLHRWKP